MRRRHSKVKPTVVSACRRPSRADARHPWRTQQLHVYTIKLLKDKTPAQPASLAHQPKPSPAWLQHPPSWAHLQRIPRLTDPSQAMKRPASMEIATPLACQFGLWRLATDWRKRSSKRQIPCRTACSTVPPDFLLWRYRQRQWRAWMPIARFHARPWARRNACWICPGPTAPVRRARAPRPIYLPAAHELPGSGGGVFASSSGYRECGRNRGRCSRPRGTRALQRRVTTLYHPVTSCPDLLKAWKLVTASLALVSALLACYQLAQSACWPTDSSSGRCMTAPAQGNCPA